MRVPLEWLKEYVQVRLRPEALAHRLTMAGVEVSGIARVDGEPVLDLEITPNRPDCLSIIGVAREVAAITGAKLRLPREVEGSRVKVQGKRQRPRTSDLEPRTKLFIRIEDRKGCARYLGRLIEGVRIGPSPAWMQKRLVACGLRPINNVVDITNYVLLEYGQPLHAFDAARLLESTVIVRRATAKETLVTLDDEPRTLSPDILVIADAKRPVAIAGVMGGRDTQVTDATTSMVLESAWFDPLPVRRTARALGLSSESSYRFERGVDPVGVELASQRASSLISQLANGREIAKHDVGTRRLQPVVVHLEASRLTRWLGTSIPPTTVPRVLQQLGCSVRKHGRGWRVRAPSFRRDLRQDVDLIEEIARLWGYDRLPESIPHAPLDAGHGGDTPYARAQELRRLCAGLGLWEVITWALVSETDLELLGASSGGVSLVNPISRDHAVLRPTLLVGMLPVISKNLAHGARGVRIFELGHVFESSERQPRRVRERRHLGIGIAGLWEHSWQGTSQVDLFRLKGIVEQLVARSVCQPLGAKAVSLQWAEPGQGMQLDLNGQPLGTVGQVARRICEAHDCDEPVWFAELAVEVLLGGAARTTALTIPSAFPPVKRDVSLLVDKQVAYARILELIQTMGSPLASRVELIDRYTGSAVPEAKHSLTFSIDYHHPSRTLTATEVDQLHARVIHALTERFGIQVR